MKVSGTSPSLRAPSLTRFSHLLTLPYTTTSTCTRGWGNREKLGFWKFPSQPTMFRIDEHFKFPISLLAPSGALFRNHAPQQSAQIFTHSNARVTTVTRNHFYSTKATTESSSHNSRSLHNSRNNHHMMECTNLARCMCFKFNKWLLR